MRDALENLRLEPKRKAAVTLTVAVRAGKAMSGIDQKIRALGEQRRSVPVADDEAARQDQREAARRRQLLRLAVARPASADDILHPPAIARRDGKVGNIA